MLLWLPAFWVVWPLWRSLATNLKPQKSLNNSPSGSSTVYCHTGKYSAVPFGIVFNYLGQGEKKETPHGKINYNRFHYGICLTSERLGWVMRERWLPISLESKAETHILPYHLFWWNSRDWVGWTQLLDSGNRAHRLDHILLPVLSPCRPAHRLDSPMELEDKHHHQLLEGSIDSSPASAWSPGTAGADACWELTSMVCTNISLFTAASQHIPVSGVRCGFAGVSRCHVTVCDHHLPPSFRTEM